MCRSSLFALCAWILLCAGAASAQTGRRYAVLIGVNHYDNANFSNLYYAERDVGELAKVLRQQDYDVVLLSTKDGAGAEFMPTRENIDKHLKSVFDRCKRNDLVLVAFAGHGLQFAGEKASYFVPMDAKPNDSTTMISLKDLYAKLEDCGAAQRLMLVDACRVEVKKERFRQIDGDNAPPPPKGVSVFFSCKSGQAALELNDLRHGLFFHHILEGMRGKAKNARGEITWPRLVAHTVEALEDSGHQQVPVLRGEVEGAPLLLRLTKRPFNGKNLSGWKLAGSEQYSYWAVGTTRLNELEPTRIKFSPADESTRLPELASPGRSIVSIYTEEDFGDCLIELDFMIPEKANSGVYVMGEYEIQIADSLNDTELNTDTTGAIWGYEAPKVNASKKAGEWQSLVIDFQAPRFQAGEKIRNARFLKVTMNDKMIHENVEMTSVTRGGLTGVESAKGPIYLQSNRSPVSFRNIRITPK